MTELTPHMHLPVASDLFHSTAPSGSVVNIPPARQGMHLDKGSILGLGRSAGEGVAIHSSCLEDLKNRGPWGSHRVGHN